MAIYTLSDLHARTQQRASSIPRQYHRIAQAERRDHGFSVADAAHLKLQLQALDKALPGLSPAQPSVRDITSFSDTACTQSARGASLYIAGSEEFFLVVKRVARPDLIPHVYAQACEAMVRGRPYVNRYAVSDFNKGVDPTFSDIRRLLPDIDRVCDTQLDGAVRRLEAKVRPFPFLRLPAELRLHVYSHLLPSNPKMTLPPRHHETTRPRLALMQANRQMHHEVRKYLYERVTLCMPAVFRPDSMQLFDDTVSAAYETIVGMDPDSLRFFKRLCMTIASSSGANRLGNQSGQPSIAMRHIFNTLTGLERLDITFDTSAHVSMSAQHGQDTQQKYIDEMKKRLIDDIPPSLAVSWPHADAARFFSSTAVAQRLWSAIQEARSNSTLT